jgi:hypothetical protein
MVALEDGMNAGLRLFLTALVFVTIQSSSVNAQARTQLGVGVGLGATNLSGTAANVVFADAKWTVAAPLKVGAEIWWASNQHRVCLDVCKLVFPDFAGIAPTISTGFGGGLVEFGIGPGLFKRYFLKDDNVLVGGALAHVSAAIVRSRYVHVLLSVRPFVGPRLNGQPTWVVPITVGLSR